jgi:hypothetical protein
LKAGELLIFRTQCPKADICPVSQIWPPTS